MYNRFETGVHPRDEIKDILGAAKDHSASLEDHIRLLEKVNQHATFKLPFCFSINNGVWAVSCYHF